MRTLSNPHAFAFDFAGDQFCALPQRALWWPRRRAVLVADLHLEKGSWFASHGQMLPPYDSRDTLARLAAIAGALGADDIWCLGDNFHDAAGPDRLNSADARALAALSTNHRVHFITGNHDLPKNGAPPSAMTPSAMPVICHEHSVDGIWLRHEAEPHTTEPEISGHWHPKLRVRVRGRSVRRPCFLQIGSHLILPAFGSYTGGLDVTDCAFAPLIAGNSGKPAVAMIALDDRLLQCSVAQPQPVA